MKSYASFCPVAKTAEIFAERWTPLLLRELCVGARRFSDLQQGVPLISRALLSQRLRELEDAGIIEKTASESGGTGRGEYRLTAAGEAFRPIIDLMAAWSQTHGRSRVRQEDTDPKQLIWGIRRHLDVAALPDQTLVIQFEFSGLTNAHRTERYWWLVLSSDDVDICQKNPGFDVDVVISAKLLAFTRVWLGFYGLADACRNGDVSLTGPAKVVKTACQVLGLKDRPWVRQLNFAPRRNPFAPFIETQTAAQQTG